VPVRCRLDTAEEVSIYAAGGILQRFAKDFLANASSPIHNIEQSTKKSEERLS